MKAVTALLRESHTLNKAVTALFTSKAASLNKAVIVLWDTTALLRDPYCNTMYPVYGTWYHCHQGPLALPSAPALSTAMGFDAP